MSPFDLHAISRKYGLMHSRENVKNVVLWCDGLRAEQTNPPARIKKAELELSSV